MVRRYLVTTPLVPVDAAEKSNQRRGRASVVLDYPQLISIAIEFLFPLVYRLFIGGANSLDFQNGLKMDQWRVEQVERMTLPWVPQGVE